MPCAPVGFLRGLLLCLIGQSMAGGLPLPARAEIDAWYEVTSATGAGTGVASVEQGAAGQRLTIRVEDTTEPILVTVQLKVVVPVEDAFFAYSMDLIAPDAANVAANSLTFLSPFDIEFPPTLAAGPGKLIENATEMTLSGELTGKATLFEFELEITPPINEDILIYSGIGPAEWAAWDDLPPIIRFADADPLMGNSGWPIESNTPSIVITRGGGGEPVDCNNNQTPDEDEIAADAAFDCNTNGVLDSCEITGNAALDCNGNGILDSCEIVANPILDCNANDTLDACEIASGSAADCNGNNVPDHCDIMSGASADANTNGTPDECEPAPPLPIPPAIDGSQAGNNEQSNGPRKLVDRTCLRNVLRVIFGIPQEGGTTTPLAALTLYGLNFYGVPLAAAQAVWELVSLPVRTALFEITYAILDFWLP
ncbi:MAG: hypothetical protein HBSAPP02_00450 [Phycisphaerae bacterium]|nr:MAG: hypothetical protein HRU71_04670 [Planctomycetia bacterium]GJQ25013.1 MAG: hypothetical protein HBSAPP02_00450 [Phycisphaerae bacterium]